MPSCLRIQAFPEDTSHGSLVSQDWQLYSLCAKSRDQLKGLCHQHAAWSTVPRLSFPISKTDRDVNKRFVAHSQPEAVPIRHISPSISNRSSPRGSTPSKKLQIASIPGSAAATAPWEDALLHPLTAPKFRPGRTTAQQGAELGPARRDAGV